MNSRAFAIVVLVGGIVGACPFVSGNPTPTHGSAVNLSARVELHAKPAIQGLVVEGVRVVLIRAIGPGLAPLGVENTVPDPIIVVADQHGNIFGRGIPMSELSDYEFALITRACADSGAFPVPRTSRDAVFLFPISGIVTARVASASSATGEVLIEAYILPWTEDDRGTQVSQ